MAVKDAPDAVEMPPITGKVTFDHVDFSYEDGVKILDNVSFIAQPGESFAIVGPTGAGKTTIVNLLSRFYNVDSGTVRVDDMDISKVTLHSLRTQMGVMMQDSFIFSGTIMDNIRYGNKTATDEEVIRAAKTVCAHEFIMQMEDGYQTQVNERGSLALRRTASADFLCTGAAGRPEDSDPRRGDFQHRYGNGDRAAEGTERTAERAYFLYHRPSSVYDQELRYDPVCG